MSRFFLHYQACNVSNVSLFKDGLLELNRVHESKELDDQMLKHKSIWDLDAFEKLFATGTQEIGVICKFIEQLSSIDTDIETEESFNAIYAEDTLKAFLGIEFKDLAISADKQIKDKDDYLEAKMNYLLDHINAANLWENRENLFPGLILCGEVEDQCSTLGDSPEFKKILSRLMELNRFSTNWKSGGFNQKEVVATYGLNITPESKTTMDNEKYKQERIFKLPNGNKEVFELHIKTGSLRIHIYPDNEMHKVYVGYIGKHLSTTKYN